MSESEHRPRPTSRLAAVLELQELTTFVHMRELYLAETAEKIAELERLHGTTQEAAKIYFDQVYKWGTDTEEYLAKQDEAERESVIKTILRESKHQQLLVPLAEA